MEWSGWGRGGGAPRKEGVQKGTGSGEQTQAPKHWFVELEVMSDRAGGQGLQDWSGRNREGSGSSSLSPPLSLSLLFCTSCFDHQTVAYIQIQARVRETERDKQTHENHH